MEITAASVRYHDAKLFSNSSASRKKNIRGISAAYREGGESLRRDFLFEVAFVKFRPPRIFNIRVLISALRWAGSICGILRTCARYYNPRGPTAH
jgi:hypothetical protein